MLSDVIRCSAMFGDVRRCSTMFGDVIRCSAILSELQFTIVTVSGRSAIAPEYRYRVEPGRLVRKRVKHNPGDSPLTTQRHGSQDTAPASGAGDEIPLEIDFTLSIDDEAFWEATSPSLASKD